MKKKDEQHTGIMHGIPFFELCFNHEDKDGNLEPCFAALQRVEVVYDFIDRTTQTFTAHSVYHYKCLECGEEIDHDEADWKQYTPTVDEIGIYSLGFETMTSEDLQAMDIQMEEEPALSE